MKSFSTIYKNQMKNRRGFTLIELLVATAVTAMLAGILLAMTNGVLRSWNQTTGNLSANSEAQLIIGLLKQDLQSAIYRNNHGVWMAVEVLERSTDVNNRNWTLTSRSNNRIKPDNNLSQLREISGGTELPLADTRYGLGGSWLRFFTTGGSDEVTAVAYQIARRKVTGDPIDNTNLAETRYMLYRSIVSPRETLEKGFNLNTNPFPLSPEPPANYNNPGNPLLNPPPGEVIGNNVIDFGVRLYSLDRTPSGVVLEPLFPVNASGRWSENHKEYFAYGSASNPFPDVVDIMVRILTKEGAQLIQNLEEGRIPPRNGSFDDTWWEIAEEHSRVFTQRIYVNTRPL